MCDRSSSLHSLFVKCFLLLIHIVRDRDKDMDREMRGLCYVLYTLQKDREHLFSIVLILVPVPVPVPVQCSVYETQLRRI